MCWSATLHASVLSADFKHGRTFDIILYANMQTFDLAPLVESLSVDRRKHYSSLMLFQFRSHSALISSAMALIFRDAATY
jgi:hypothetical protein